MSVKCPICKKRDLAPAFKPFCSKRCADIDLGRWFNGGYAIPTEEAAPDAELYRDEDGQVLNFPNRNDP